jgi:polyphosphate kinase
MSQGAAARENAEGHPHFINRELSWLAFNSRVLDQAADTRWPLLERVKFLAIFGSNLDEFFMIRVSGLHEQLESDAELESPDGISVRDQLAKIREVVLAQLARADRLFRDELLPALGSERIRLLSWSALSERQQAWARDHFHSKVFPVLTPLAVDPAHPFPFLSNLSLSLAVEAEDPETLERRFARVKVPESLTRFIAVPSDDLANDGAPHPSHDFITAEELIAANLSSLFAGMNILGAYPLRVTRDMDLDILEEEAEDLLSLVDREIRRRRFGAAVRLEASPEMPEAVRQFLMEKLEIGREDVYESHAILNLSGLFAIAHLPVPALHDPVFLPRICAEWEPRADPFATIAARDILLHHPYESFTPVLEFLRNAADDPHVLAIKMTLYRAGANSEAVRTLIRAAENGKQVAVSIELKARFDEANNIGWARALERAGVHVFYGISGLKTHAKVLLIVRKEGEVLRRYVHLSTGNYNASTAKLYTDLGLFTADPEIGRDASELFNSLSGFSRSAVYKKLYVAPHDLRRVFIAKIEGQIARARAGNGGRVFAKLNALVDGDIIRKLYEASQAGVQVELCVRGICCLKPGLPGVSDNIRVRSVLGRFLEHERIYVFGLPGEEEFFLSSADWMPRNLDRRVEVLFPIESERLRERIRAECLRPLQASPGVYEMLPDGSYRSLSTDGHPPRSSASPSATDSQFQRSGPDGKVHDVQFHAFEAVLARLAPERTNGSAHLAEL